MTVAFSLEDAELASSIMLEVDEKLDEIASRFDMVEAPGASTSHLTEMFRCITRFRAEMAHHIALEETKRTWEKKE